MITEEMQEQKECVFVNSALKIQCQIVKNIILHCLFGDFAHCVMLELDRFVRTRHQLVKTN